MTTTEIKSRFYRLDAIRKARAERLREIKRLAELARCLRVAGWVC